MREVSPTGERLSQEAWLLLLSQPHLIGICRDLGMRLRNSLLAKNIRKTL